MNKTFAKHEKLKSKKAIEQLFLKGKRIKKFPIQLLYVEKTDDECVIQVGFVAPKKKIKLAVHRNKIKRLLKETFRKNKSIFYKNIVNSHNLMFIYVAHTEISYAEIEIAMVKLGVEFDKKKEREKNKK